MDDDNDLASSGEEIRFINAKEKNGYVEEYVEIEELSMIKKPWRRKRLPLILLNTSILVSASSVRMSSLDLLFNLKVST